jgi:putative integral membrane protein (TIGR02587 family)
MSHRLETARSAQGDPWGFRREGRDLLVAITGGAIVGMPLLYTMEMWLHGTLLRPAQQLALLFGTLFINFLFSIVSGFRHEDGLASAALESVTAVGIGLVFSALILWLVGEIVAGDPASEVIGKVLFQTVPVSIGVSVADAHVRGQRRDGSEKEGRDGTGRDGTGEGAEKPPPRAQLETRQLRQDIRDVTATLMGALLFSINIGPTEEVVLIAGRLSPAHLLIVVVASLSLCYVILYASGIKDHPVHVPSLVQSPPSETIITYTASLGVALALLWILGEPETIGSSSDVVASTVVLGLPTAVGGAAGRLAL